MIQLIIIATERKMCMRILYNEHLKKYTTVKIGGTASKLYIPENEAELIHLLNSMHSQRYYIIGGGSNLLINDEKVFENVILMKEFNDFIEEKGDGTYYIGASNKLQKVINKINEDGFGGIEYLYSVPGLIGGAVAMNAGRGKPYGVSISDYIIDVTVYINGKVKTINKEQCRFDYRNSIFRENSDYIILGCTFKFERKSKEESKRLKEERIKLCKMVQDTSGYNFGSVFKVNDWKVMWFVRNISIVNKKGIHFSKKTPNWMVNKGEGTFKQAIKIIKRVEYLHRIIGKKAVPEVIIWE